MRIEPGIVAFTLVEDLGLVAWLALVRAAGLLSKVLGVLVLPVAFFVEHVLAANVKRGAPLLRFGVWWVRSADPLRPARTTLPFGRIAINAALETVLWVVWLALWSLYPISIAGVGIPLYAIAWLQLALIVEHSLTDNIFHGRPLFENLLNQKVIGFSTVENVGATGWLGFIGAGLPLVAVLWLVVWQHVEHQQAISLARTA